MDKIIKYLNKDIIKHNIKILSEIQKELKSSLKLFMTGDINENQSFIQSNMANISNDLYFLHYNLSLLGKNAIKKPSQPYQRFEIRKLILKIKLKKEFFLVIKDSYYERLTVNFSHNSNQIINEIDFAYDRFLKYENIYKLFLDFKNFNIEFNNSRTDINEKFEKLVAHKIRIEKINKVTNYER